MKNIVLIGMPGSGKTTIGNIISTITGKTLIDTDDEIVKKIKMPISEYFKKFSHEEFRKVEVEVIAELSKKSDCVISSGGGAVLNPQNVINFKKNGVLFFLNRNTETLIKNCHCNDGQNTGVRPLVRSAEDIQKLYAERLPIYKSACDVEIEDNPSAENIANQIIEKHSKAASNKITVSAPPSKSYSHRMIICAALANGTSVLSNYSTSDDMVATLNCVSQFGAKYSISGDKITITGSENYSPNNVEALYNCNESGSTLRFFIPIALALTDGGKFIGSSRLIERGIGVYEQIFANSGISITKNQNSIDIHGKLPAKNYQLPGNVSSQFITGLLFALPLLHEDSTIQITTELESAAYVDMTLQILQKFGVIIEKKSDNEYFVRGNQKYTAQNLEIEGDWSNAAPFFALDFEVSGLNPESFQGDRVCIELMEEIRGSGEGNEGSRNEINISNCPDLGPILFAYAATHGGATFTGTSRLRIKECDRAQAMKDELAKFGVPVTIEQNSVTIGHATLHSPTEQLSSHNDHRIVMAMTYLCLQKGIGGTICGVNAINKSFPTFFEKLKNAGIKIGEIECNCLKIQKS